MAGCNLGGLSRLMPDKAPRKDSTTRPARAEMSASFAGKEASRGILANNEPPMSIVYPCMSARQTSCTWCRWAYFQLPADGRQGRTRGRCEALSKV
ncbi:hypothetical protein V8C43DRAFT_293518 [Trichoderma afarasin]